MLNGLVSHIVNGLNHKDRLLISRFTFLSGDFRPIREFFTHLETSPLPVMLPILIYTRYSWQLSSEDSLKCHTYCDTGQPFIIVITSDTHTCCRAFYSGAVTSCFIDLHVRLSRSGIERPISRMRGVRSTTTPPWRLKKLCADVFVFLLMYICIRYKVSFSLYSAFRHLFYHLSKQNV